MDASMESTNRSSPSSVLEVVALDHNPVRRRYPLDLLGAEHRPAADFGDPEGERGRVVLLGDAVLGDVAVEVIQARQRSSAPLRLAVKDGFSVTACVHVISAVQGVVPISSLEGRSSVARQRSRRPLCVRAMASSSPTAIAITAITTIGSAHVPRRPIAPASSAVSAAWPAIPSARWK
jgi:hypothetical protein